MLLYVPTITVVALVVYLHWYHPEYVVYTLPFLAVTIHGVGRTDRPGKKTRGIGGPIGETFVGIGLLALAAHLHPLGNDVVYLLMGVIPVVAFGMFFGLHRRPRKVVTGVVSRTSVWCGMIVAPLWMFIPVDAVWGVAVAAATLAGCRCIMRRRHCHKM